MLPFFSSFLHNKYHFKIVYFIVIFVVVVKRDDKLKS